MKRCFEQFEASNAVPANVKWTVSGPMNSMAWHDLKNGLMTSDEKIKKVNLPPAIMRMIGEEAKMEMMSRKMFNGKPVRLTGANAQPLMSLHLMPPHLSGIPAFKPSIPPPTIFGGGGENNIRNNWRTMSEEKMLDVLAQVNTIAQAIAKVMGTTIHAFIERRKTDNALCLFVCFHGFPWAVVGGGSVIPEEYAGQAPPRNKIFESWRMELFESLRAFLPPTLHSKMADHIDRSVNMEWNMRLIASEDFREIVKRIMELKDNPSYKRLWNINPVEFDPQDTELVTARGAIMRQIEEEVRSFWTFERNHVHLRTNQ